MTGSGTCSADSKNSSGAGRSRCGGRRSSSGGERRRCRDRRKP